MSELGLLPTGVCLWALMYERFLLTLKNFTQIKLWFMKKRAMLEQFYLLVLTFLLEISKLLSRKLYNFKRKKEQKIKKRLNYTLKCQLCGNYAVNMNYFFFFSSCWSLILNVNHFHFFSWTLCIVDDHFFGSYRSMCRYWSM